MTQNCLDDVFVEHTHNVDYIVVDRREIGGNRFVTPQLDFVRALGTSNRRSFLPVHKVSYTSGTIHVSVYACL